MEHRIDLFTEYDIDEQGYVRNETDRLMGDVVDGLLAEIPQEIQDTWEYFSAMTRNQLFPRKRLWRVIVYTCPGGNEGWYVHVDALLRNGSCKALLVGKFLCGVENAFALQTWLWGKIYL